MARNIRTLYCVAASSWLAAQAAGACEAPTLVAVPTAEEAENLEQEARELEPRVQEYHAAMQEYISCLDANYEAAKEEGRPELIQSLLARRNNAAVAELEAVVRQFNGLVDELSNDAGGRE